MATPVPAIQQLSFAHWLAAIDITIDNEIAACHPRSWQEDVISYAWLRRITSRFKHIQVNDVETPFTVAWDVYKSDGKIEEGHGDIGVVVVMHFLLNGRVSKATGVGFLEAKRIDEAKSGYTRLSWEQLETQTRNIAAHRVLLYDFQPVSQAGRRLDAHGYCRHLDKRLYGRVHASVIPTPHVLAIRDRSRDLASFGVPLGYQICTRYLRGLDLDYGIEPERFFADIPGGPEFMLVASVASAQLGTPAAATAAPAGYSPSGASGEKVAHAAEAVAAVAVKVR
jgi:hypothetical protein